ncbi:RIP metalloprotease RseP-like protein, partial [Bordetella hinzii L60]
MDRCALAPVRPPVLGRPGATGGPRRERRAAHAGAGLAARRAPRSLRG